MELQLALDFLHSIEEGRKIISQVADSVDIIEVGTPFIMECGLEPVRAFKEEYPKKKILADLKIADAGYYEAAAAFAQGADIVTVLAVMDDATIINTKKAADEYCGKVMVDMLAVIDLPKRLQEIDQIGVDYICLHISKDLQRLDTDMSKAFMQLRKYVKKAKLAIAGGIRPETAAQYASVLPDVLIVGEGIASNQNQSDAASKIRVAMCEFE